MIFRGNCSPDFSICIGPDSSFLFRVSDYTEPGERRFELGWKHTYEANRGFEQGSYGRGYFWV
jgi:hypothetical protein